MENENEFNQQIIEPKTNETKQKWNLCIPRMENKIIKKEIFNVFKKLNIGYIEKIIELPLKNETEYKRIIIKIKWNNTQQSEKIQSRLHNGEPVYIVYEMPWFWKIVLCNK